MDIAAVSTNSEGSQKKSPRGQSTSSRDKKHSLSIKEASKPLALPKDSIQLKSKNKSIALNCGIIIFLYLLAIGADFLCAWSPTEAPIKRVSYSPPTKFQFEWKHGIFFHPYSIQINQATFDRKFDLNKNKICTVNLFAKGSEYNFFRIIKSNLHLIGSNNCKNDFHFLGTDKLGRDYFARLIHGLRPSLFTGILGILISFPLGLIYGTVAGYLSDEIGELMMRFVEIVLSLPTLYLLVVLAGILPAGLSGFQRLSLITVIISFIGWAGLARVLRGQVLSINRREYVQAAVLIGAPNWKIILREIIPQLSTYLIIAATLSFPSYILAETTLSFLGLGISQPDSSLGNILAEGRKLSNLFLYPWMALGPTFVIVLLTWACNSLGDSLRDAFDVKS